MICFYQGTYGERIPQTLESIKNAVKAVDRTIIIVDETVTEEQKQQLQKLGCEVYVHKWTDSFVQMRNHALNKIQSNDWVICCDPDEIFNEQFCKDVRELCRKAEESGIDLLLINSHDTTIKADNSEDSSISDFFKNLIFHKRIGTQYKGVGETEVHEALEIPGITKAVRLPKEKYWYRHIKYWHEVWERAARNCFCGGGGNNAGTRNPSWNPLRDICTELGLNTWPQAREYFRNGDIDPRLKKWLWVNRTEGWDYDHEELEFGRWYFEYLHPEEAEGWKPILEVPVGSPPEVMQYVENTYMKVFGRHADQEGKEAYTSAIVEGRMRREDLAEILKRSPEYVQKAQASMESIRLQVPVNVDVKVSEYLFIQALSRSETYWKKIKPRLDLGIFIEQSLGEEEWKNFQAWFYAEKPNLKQFMEKLAEVTER